MVKKEIIHKKYILTKKGLKLQKTYEKFRETFFSNYNCGDMDGKTIRFDFNDVNAYITPLYTENNKHLNFNMFLIANSNADEQIENMINQIKSKGFSLEQITN